MTTSTFCVGDEVIYPIHDGTRFTGTVAELLDDEQVLIDTTVYEYRPQYVTRPASMVRHAVFIEGMPAS